MLQVRKLRPRRDSLPKDHKAYSEQNQHGVRGGGRHIPPARYVLIRSGLSALMFSIQDLELSKRLPEGSPPPASLPPWVSELSTFLEPFALWKACYTLGDFSL